MVWYGPGGIGTCGGSVDAYQRGHQLPFRAGLADKAFHGHI